MAQETWHYLENQFDNATEGSFKLMNILNADHLARLQAQQSDADIAALLARTTPLHDNYNTAYSAWLSAKASYKGETDRMNVFIDDLRSVKIKQWDIQIQQQFIEGTGETSITDADGGYAIATAHSGPAHLEFVFAGYLSETFAIDVPEGGSVTQNLTMNPAP